MERLELIGLLAENTDAPLHALAGHLRSSLGIDVTARRHASWAHVAPSPAAVHRMVWACGLLTIDLLDDGALEGEVVAAPVFAGEERPVYRSVIVANPGTTGLGDLAGTRLVINEEGSWSGNLALAAHLVEIGAPEGFVGTVLRSGSHARSLAMVAAGEADFASIDHTVWDHHRDRFPDGRPSVVATTRDWPAPPITATKGTPPEWVEALYGVPGGRVVSRLVPAATADYTPIRRTASALGWRKKRRSDPDRDR